MPLVTRPAFRHVDWGRPICPKVGQGQKPTREMQLINGDARQHHYATLKGVAQVSQCRTQGLAPVRRVSVASPCWTVAQFSPLLAHRNKLAHVAAGVQPLLAAKLTLSDHVFE